MNDARRFVALLRAVNVGGTGKLPMTELKAMCEDAGFADVKTYIASGNVVFSTGEDEAAIKSALESRLEAYAGKPVAVFVRDGEAMQRVIDSNPFADRDPKRTTACFLEHPPAPDALDEAKNLNGELIATGEREIYIHYPDGISQSKLKLPAAQAGTARNINTVARLLAMLRGA